jgi:hypothetical protein
MLAKHGQQLRIHAIGMCCIGIVWLSPIGCSSSIDSTISEIAEADDNIGSITVERGPVRITLQIDPKSARLSDEPKLTISIEHEVGVEVTKPPFGESLGDFLILNFHEPLPKTVGDRQVIQQVYTLEPTRAGRLTISPISVSFVDKRANGDGQVHVIETEPLPIEITTMLDSEAPSLADLRPPAEPVEIAQPAAAWPRYAIRSIPFVLLALILWWRLRRTRETIVPQLSPEELARQELDALVARRLDQTDIKDFYVELTGIVRRYIERTTNVKAPEQTTDEFLRATADHPGFSLDERGRLREFLESADLVKYAALQPGEQDIETAIQRARRFTTRQPATSEVGV